ncbi:UNVERIFIED_CONTAM: hypothetical protein Sradi_7306000 [Sesamum radiatum]|uniref:Uncharacterized protein n=1 Tax=Sesamum radiatum TaxID=300843 RepID=A0AAW2I870_SESRA
MKGVVTPEDRRLLNPLGREDLERNAALFLLKGMAACEVLFSRYQGCRLPTRGRPRPRKWRRKSSVWRRRLPI